MLRHGMSSICSFERFPSTWVCVCASFWGDVKKQGVENLLIKFIF
jgi:hypothetical protein